jgi:hypothetical protein
MLKPDTVGFALDPHFLKTTAAVWREVDSLELFGLNNAWSLQVPARRLPLAVSAAVWIQGMVLLLQTTCAAPKRKLSCQPRQSFRQSKELPTVLRAF